MALSKEQKARTVEKLRESIAKQKAMVFVNFAGLTAQETEDLRAKLKENNAKFVIAKKTLAKLAFSQEGIDMSEQTMTNELGIVFAFGDEISPAKATYNFSKTQKNLQIIGGHGESGFINQEDMIVLAQLPSKQELFGRLVGTLSAPIANFISVQRENIKGLIYALKAIEQNNS